MSGIVITGINFRNHMPRGGGNCLLCYFDCEVGGIRLLGCQLVRTPRDGLVAFPPRIADPAGKGRLAVAIIDNGLRHAMMDAARNAYRALGGTEAEWEPHITRAEAPVVNDTDGER